MLLLSSVYKITQAVNRIQISGPILRAMRSKKRTIAAPGGAALSSSIDAAGQMLQNQLCFEGEKLTRFLVSIRREIESSIALASTLPLKFWIKQQFAVGVNEVTRVLERMPPSRPIECSLATSKTPCVHLQAILVASDCNPRWLTKHLPALAASRNVPLILVKDRKEGSLRLGELIKLKTAITIGIKAKGNDLNRLIKEVLDDDKTDGIEE